MKRLSTGVLVSLMVASLGLTAVAAPSAPGSSGSHVVAQATDTPTPSTTMQPGGTSGSGTTGTESPTPTETSGASGTGTTGTGTSGSGTTGTQSQTQGTGTSGGTMNMPPMNFGSPPSGQIPILFNDHHVYSKPDTLRQGRVLAALVRGGTVLIPLRSMFEQMGATVSYNPSTRTAVVTKPGSEVRVTVGKPEVVVNGETRPLDVPPMMYQGNVLVPVRVISEGMGAYVQWVPDKRVVVVRYMPATPAPPPPPPATGPSATPAPTPTPAPAATPYLDHFIAGDYIFAPKVYNEFSPGNTGKGGSYDVRGAIEFSAFNLPWMLEGDFRSFQYPHNCGSAAPTPGLPFTGDPQCRVTVIGGLGSTYVPGFTARDQDFEGRFGLKVADPRIYLGVGYMYRTTNYGYPRQNGVGFGLEKLPDLNQPFSVYGSAWYYPNAKGTCDITVCPTGPYNLAYRILTYQLGGAVNFGASGVFLDFGWVGDSGRNKQNAPVDFTHNGPYVGLGIHF